MKRKTPGRPQILKGRDHQHVSNNLSLSVRAQHSSFLLVEKHTTEDNNYCIDILKRKYENC